MTQASSSPMSPLARPLPHPATHKDIATIFFSWSNTHSSKQKITDFIRAGTSGYMADAQQNWNSDEETYQNTPEAVLIYHPLPSKP